MKNLFLVPVLVLLTSCGPQLRLNKDRMTICSKKRWPIRQVAVIPCETTQRIFFYSVGNMECTEFSLKTLSPEYFKPDSSFKYDTGRVYWVSAAMGVCSGGIAVKVKVNPDGQVVLAPKPNRE